MQAILQAEHHKQAQSQQQRNSSNAYTYTSYGTGATFPGLHLLQHLPVCLSCKRNAEQQPAHFAQQ
jgi:hypothetical protein